MGRSHRPGQSGSRKGEYLMAKICMAGAGSVIETAEYKKKEMLERGGISLNSKTKCAIFKTALVLI